MDERIADVGYINPEMKHCLISIYNPSLLNSDGKEFVQVAITVDNAIILRANLNKFLLDHGLQVN